MLAVVFITGLAVLNLISSKIMTLWGLTFSVGSLVYAITFPITDVISEIWGKKRATRLVWLGFGANILVLIIVYIAVYAPPAPFWLGQKAYAQTLGIVGRIVLGSMFAYLISQHHDVWSFHWWKRKTGSKYLWLRNNLSTMSSQLLDSIIFILVAFLWYTSTECTYSNHLWNVGCKSRTCSSRYTRCLSSCPLVQIYK